ncbi:MAG: PhzF family phenazine biosynthesis protein [Rickettsiales bacterium]|nr:PhzF family phenazine biosynthesis protein [Rickettsiales bacterium]
MGQDAMMDHVWIIDAFTSVPFRGNPAGVMLCEQFPQDAKMQHTAACVNLSETAFVVQKSARDYDLRWFTPDIEVKLCGHATLAATHVLKQTGQVKTGDTITFHTLSGALPVKLLEKTIELNFPNQPGVAAKAPAALNALGVEIVACQRNDTNFLVEVKDYKTLLACKPDFKKLKKLAAQGVIVTTATGVPAGFDFASRYFAPAAGINEDPVTGSAHCFLAPYWAEKLGKKTFRAYQASKGRGELDVTLAGDRVLITGSAVTTLKGKLAA